MTDFQLSSYSLIGYIRTVLVSGAFTDLARKGMFSGIEYSAPGSYKLYVAHPVDLARLKMTVFLFLGDVPPPIPLDVQILPLSVPVTAPSEPIGFDVRVYDTTGIQADPPDDTNFYIAFEQAPY